MLYDPKWEQNTKTPSLAGFIAWLETQDPNTKYKFIDPTRCAVARYLRAIGAKKTTYSCVDDVIPNVERLVLFPEVVSTYGAVLERAHFDARLAAE